MLIIVFILGNSCGYVPIVVAVMEYQLWVKSLTSGVLDHIPTSLVAE